MLFIGGIQAYTVVWDLGDVGIGLMTIFNLAVLFPLSNEALSALAEYEKKKKKVEDTSVEKLLDIYDVLLAGVESDD